MPFLYLTRGVKVDTRGINAPIDSIQTKDQISRKKKASMNRNEYNRSSVVGRL